MRYVLVNAILIGLAEMAQRRLRAKIGDLRQAVPGRFNNHHARMVKELLAHIDYLSAAVDRLDEQIDVMMVPFVAARDRLDTIPGIAKRTAEIIIAEIGVDMTRFATPRPFGIVGRAVSGKQRVRRETPCHDNTFGEPVVDLSTG